MMISVDNEGPLPKVECARVFSARGCSICLNIFDSQAAARYHRSACQYSRAAPVVFSTPFSQEFF